MSWLDATADVAAQWLYDTFKTTDSGPSHQAMNVPYSPMANTPDRVPPQAPMEITTPDGLLKQMHLTDHGTGRPQVPNSPMANAPEQYAGAEIPADETIQGALSTVQPEGEESDRTTNRKLAMLGLGLKAAGELMQQHMGQGINVRDAGTGRSYHSPDAYQQLQAQKRQAALHPVDWSKLLGRGLLR
jgi:hypothetical protein